MPNNGENKQNKSYEFLYRAIMAHAPFPVYVKDETFRFIDLNPAFEQAFDVRKQELLGELAGIHLPPTERAKAVAHDSRVADSRQPSTQIEKIGNKIYKVYKYPIIETGQLHGIVGFDLDITDLKEAESRLIDRQIHLETQSAELRAAKQEAEKANKAKSDFLATMSHELRTPLSAMLSFSKVLSMRDTLGVTEEALSEYSDIIHNASQHLLSLLNDLLDLSKIESGTVELDESVVNLREVTRDVVILFSKQAAEKNLVLRISPESENLSLWADERKSQQIILNLISNAIKFTPDNGEVLVSICRTSEGWPSLTVSDTGPGMTPKDSVRAMEPFAQVSDPANNIVEGTGLGLTLVKALAELHGGELTLESQPGVGTDVRVAFPKDRIRDNMGSEECAANQRGISKIQNRA